MKIIHLSAEFSPLAKAGGLGDVLVGLGRELTKLGEDTSIILPKYDFLELKTLKLDLEDFTCEEKGISHTNRMWSTMVEDCKLLLLETDHPKEYFQRGTIYGCKDDTARFLYFSKACLEYLVAKNEKVNVLHLHDWHTSAAAVLAKDFFNLSLDTILLTIHNAQHQGKAASWDLDAIGLKGKTYLEKEKLQDEEHPRTINLLKGGIIYADKVNTVSPTYAKEILTPKIGGTLSKVLRKHKDKLSGILNSIDQTIWDPSRDKYITANYGAKDPVEKILAAKEVARNQLSKQFGLGENRRPWVGSITRLVSQKSPELLEEGLLKTLKLGGSFLLLGSSPIHSLQVHFNKLKKKYANNKNVLFIFEYNEILSHQLYAAFDFFLMPSLFEPCGLAQLISMRYGTLPIVRKTGGLQDTVFDRENGFVFEKATKKDTRDAVERAIDLFREDKRAFHKMIKRAMNQDFGWKEAAQQYLDLYKYANPLDL